MIDLSISEARQLALAAQGFGGRRSRTIDDVLHHVHPLQIDSVNVYSRSHYMPAFSRLGDYRTTQLDDELWRSGRYTEYWAHEAAFIPIADRRLFGWRMDDYRERHERQGRTDALAGATALVREQLRANGPSLVSELEAETRANRGQWWDWSDTKRAVEMLFASGEVVSLGRERFMRRYALAHDVFAEEHRTFLPRAEAQRELIERAARGLGVATLHDLADYYRLSLTDARAAVQTLEHSGVLVPARVASWVDARGRDLHAWVHRDTEPAGRVLPDALLTPFDPVCWFRPRTERLFDFHYRIEIYTPREQRRYGYYCLPLMVGGRLVGRIDLKADRRNRALVVQAAWQEEKAPKRAADTALRLLRTAAEWQDLDDIVTTGAGNLPLPGLRVIA